MRYQKSSYLLVFGIVLFLAGGCGVGRQSALSRKLFVKTGDKVKENTSVQLNENEQNQKMSSTVYLAFNENTAEDEVFLGNKVENSVSSEQSEAKTETVENKLLVNDKTIITSKISKQNTCQPTQEKKSNEKQTKLFSILGLSLSLLAFLTFFASIFVTLIGFVVLLIAIIALILSVISLKNNKLENLNDKKHKSFSIVGIVFSAITLFAVLALLIAALGWVLGWWGGTLL